MPKQIDPRELDAIGAAVGRHPSGASISDIEAALVFPMERRTLQRRLDLLRKQGRIGKKGARRGTKYFLREAALPAAPARPLGAPAELAEGKAPQRSTERRLTLDVSQASRAIFDAVTMPVQKRKRVGYERAFLDNYEPNKTHYLSQSTRLRLEEIGRSDREVRPAGTYTRQVLDRLLIDLSFHSSRLEGNTYSLLETKRLIELERAATGRDAKETQMILNHKAAIEFLVESAEGIGIDRRTILNLHAILSENLLGDPGAGGRIRASPAEIGLSVYSPLAVPQLIYECFGQIVHTAASIEDPFEQSFFVLVHIPYLQPFDDVNKRVSRLAANIPLITHNLRPLSFIDVPRDDYIAGLLGVYERNEIELLRDVFVWAYERSAQQYAAITKTLGDPDAFRLRYRAEIKQAVADVVRRCVPAGEALQFIEQWAHANIEGADRSKFIAVVEADLVGLHEGNFARYPVTPGEFDAWVAKDPG